MFKFKFAPILNYRKQREETVQQEFAASKELWTQERLKLESYYASWKRNMNQWRDNQHGVLSIQELDLYRTYFLNLKSQIDHQIKKVRQCVEEMEKRRLLLLDARKEKKRLERLQEKHLDEYACEQKKKEQKFLDEIATQRFMIKGRKGETKA